MPNPPKLLSAKDLEDVETMAGLGMRFEDIARMKGMSDDTLKKYAKEQLDRGKAKAKAAVMQTAYKMAVSGKFPAMTMFWLKTQAAWRENGIEESKANSITDFKRVDSFLQETITQVNSGQLDPKVAHTVGYLSGILLKAIEQTELDKRLSAMESVLQKQPDINKSPLDQEITIDSAEIDFCAAGHASLMSTSNQRLQKIALSLTPKQAVLARLEEARPFKTMQEEALWLSQPQNMAQVHQRWDSVFEGIKKALKGQPKEVIQKAIKRAQRDICFLLVLHQGVNDHIFEDENTHNLMAAYLYFQLHTYMKEDCASQTLTGTIEYLGTTPYPLDKDTAAIAEHLVKNAVHTLCITDHQIGDWLEAHEDAPMAYERFKTAVQALIQDKTLQSGQIVNLTTIPIMGFRDVPLIQEEWVDQGLIEMAEWGALLEQKGYQTKQPDDDHPLAMDSFYPPNTSWTKKELPQPAPWLEIQIIRETVQENWQNYSGIIKIMDDRPCIRLEDYMKWDKRFYAGPFEIEEGVLTQSWNDWLDEGHGEAELAGIKVEKLDYWFDTASYVICETAVDALSKQEDRRSQIASLRDFIVNRYEAEADYDIDRWSYGIGNRQLPLDDASFKEKLLGWQKTISKFLILHYATLEAVKLIEKQYFDRHTLLYQEVCDGIQQRIQQLEGEVDAYNACLADTLGDPSAQKDSLTINLDAVKQQTQQTSVGIAKGIVKRAKAQMLDQLDYDEEAKALHREMLA